MRENILSVQPITKISAKNYLGQKVKTKEQN